MSYNTGDLVWAKMKGFSPWPGQISVPSSEFQPSESISNLYCIYFFGTHNYGLVGANDIKPYHQHKEEMIELNQTTELKYAIIEIEKYIEEESKKSTAILDSIEDSKDVDKNEDKIEESIEYASDSKEGIITATVPKKSTDILDNCKDSEEFDDVVEVKTEKFEEATSDYEQSINTATVPKYKSLSEKLDQLICGNCNECFLSTKDYRRHLLTHKQNAESPTKKSPTNGKYIFGGNKDKNSANKKCDKCNKTFSVNSQFVIHMKAHAGIKDLVCRYCGKGFTYQNCLVDHERRHTGERRYKCTKCDKRFINGGELTKHLDIHENNIYNCGKCKKAFTNKECFDNHIRHHNKTKIKKHRCETCGMMFARREHLNGHVARQHTKSKDHKCPYCNQGFAVKNDVTSHIWKMHKPKKYECDYCKKVFPYKQYISKHIVAMHLDSLYCNVCMSAFINSEELEKHKMKHCVKKESTCKFCNQKFLNHVKMKTHMRIVHAKEAQYKCSGCVACGGNKISRKIECFVKLNQLYCCRRTKCSKYFWKIEEYKDHLLFHKNNPVRRRAKVQGNPVDKKIVCNTCNKSVWTRHMKAHLRKHDGIYPYNCYKCGKGFSYPSTLEQHMWAHAGIKEFHCSYCNKACSTLRSCKSHELTHDTDRPVKRLKCPHCIRRFSCEKYLSNHILTLHSGASFDCASCNEVFNIKRDLTRHVLHYHSKECVIKASN